MRVRISTPAVQVVNIEGLSIEDAGKLLRLLGSTAQEDLFELYDHLGKIPEVSAEGERFTIDTNNQSAIEIREIKSA